MHNNFDWALVPSFLAALDQGSLLGASRVLKTSQPTVGRQIAQLESQLGAVLFERTGRGLLPNDLALRLADAARHMQVGADQLARSASGAQAGIAGTVRITASQPVAQTLLPPVLAQLRALQPDIQIELVASNEVSNLLRREADIALRMVLPDQTSLIAKRIGKVAIVACAHQDYLRLRGVPKSVSDLLAHDLIGNDRDEAIIRGSQALGWPLVRENFAFRTDDLMTYWQAVRSGLGIGFVTDYLLRTDPKVQAVLPGIKIPPIPIWLAVHREIRTNKRIRAVYDFLAEVLPDKL